MHTVEQLIGDRSSVVVLRSRRAPHRAAVGRDQTYYLLLIVGTSRRSIRLARVSSLHVIEPAHQAPF